ncbi:hypothetical protein Tco_1258450 [Tanacetum coccineum]
MIRCNKRLAKTIPLTINKLEDEVERTIVIGSIIGYHMDDKEHDVDAIIGEETAINANGVGTAPKKNGFGGQLGHAMSVGLSWLDIRHGNVAKWDCFHEQLLNLYVMPKIEM